MAAKPQSADPNVPAGEVSPGDGEAQSGEGQAHILARGPWPLQQVKASWREEHYRPSEAESEAADAAIEALRKRGSPSHDGMAARLLDYSEDEAGGIAIELQPQRWALRLLAGDASQSVAALCVTRSADGRWLAGRRAAWVASWAGRWALGAGGAVDLDENPADTLVRELAEEWSVAPQRVRGEALVQLPHGLVMFVGQAWLAEGVDTEVKPDAEHDEFAWWPSEIEDWPDEAEEPLRRMAQWLVAE
ncbi:MAG TPA: NUDIX domain-containing protein [Solirubrobacteraceae bacterium]|nr:NUDIX domain-containing protein [Solirubrobacteraceae bacterium]